MIRTCNARRAGFTLVELLVSVSIFIGLAGLVLLLYPSARDQDRVRYAVSDVGAHLRMAQSMAARDKAPRWVRFLVSLDPTNPDKTDPRWATELQFIEQPPPLIPNRTPLSNVNGNANFDPNNDPRVRFSYTFSTGGGGQPAGTITGRACTIENLSQGQSALIQPGCTLEMPVLGFWSKIVPVSSTVPQPVTVSGPNANGLYTAQVVLEVYPDAVMGGSTENLTYQFAIYLLPTPLVGEPTILLPKNICVDLNVSVPATTGATDFDVLFGPDGKLVNSPGGQLFLWVRDYTKTAPYSGTGASMQYLSDTTTPTLDEALKRGGEQHAIMIRSSGAHGNNQIAWPDPALGRWQSRQEPFSLVRQEIRQ